tara:strand:- start:866 stop:1762 length:897 start_codon:yes stop_codon:yes gene_type:complete
MTSGVRFLHEQWGTLNRDGTNPPIFPGPQPISIERKHFPTLKNNKYLVCEKTDGVRRALVCTIEDGVRVTVLIDRKLDVTPIKVAMPRSAYKGTIMDGELLDDGRFIVYDALILSGLAVKERKLTTRLKAIEAFVGGILQTPSNTIQVKLKTFYPIRDVYRFYTEYMPTLTYKTDGLVFTPVDEPMRKGTHETMFKWKPRDMNTIDFQLKRRGEKWNMHIQERGRLIFESIIKHNEDWMKEDMIVECQYMIDGPTPWWKPVGVRTDKDYPNNRRTFYRTIQNIRENIQRREFADIFSI